MQRDIIAIFTGFALKVTTSTTFVSPTMAEPAKENVTALLNLTKTSIAASDDRPTQKKRKQPAKAKTPRKPKVTKKDLKEKVKNATDAEMMDLLSGIFEQHPEVIPAFNEFMPARMVKSKPDDPILNKCCCCRETSGLVPFEDDIKICASCTKTLEGGFTRTEACAQFGFSQAEAKNIPHKESTH